GPSRTPMEAPYADAPTETCALPASITTSPERPEVTGMWRVTSVRWPTAPMTAVGQMSAPRVALYSETLPDTTGTPSARHAAEMPAIVRSSCHAPSGRSGLPRLRQSVIASGVAPTQTTLRSASATADAAPTNGSSAPTRG